MHGDEPAIRRDAIDLRATIHPREIFRGVSLLCGRGRFGGKTRLDRSAGKGQPGKNAQNDATKIDWTEPTHNGSQSKLRARQV